VARPGTRVTLVPQSQGGPPGGSQDQEHGLIGRVAGAVTGRMVGMVPIEAVLDNVDVNAVLDEVDVNRLIERVDLDRLIERVDLDAVLARVDMERVVQRAGIPQIVAETTGHLAGGTLDLARARLADADRLAAVIVDRLTLRRRTRPVWYDAASGRTTPYAGAVSRLLAWLVDLGVVLGGYSAATAVLRILVDALGISGNWITDRAAEFLAAIALGVWAALYATIGVAVADATVGKWLVGIRVRRADGREVGPFRALVRAVAFALSTVVGFVGLALIAFQRRSRGLHDLIADTVVVHIPRR
jgi:uncharacterized RDD family membrane protein YckC